MLRDEFKERYKTIPLAVYQAESHGGESAALSHMHKEAELILVKEGGAEFFVNSERYQLFEGDALVIPPFAVHRAMTEPGVFTSYYCVCFDLSLICDKELKDGLESERLTVENPITKDKPFADTVADGIRRAFFAYERGNAGWELDAVGGISLLLGAIKCVGGIKQACGPVSNFAREVMEYVDSGFSENISSADASAKLHISHGYFCRNFKKTFGTSFEKYLLAYRLERARMMLLTSDLSVTEIAYCTGFGGCSYFGKRFKEKYNTTPVEYRKNEK